MWELDCEESWVLKNWCFWTVVLEKTLESPLDCKEIQPVHPKGDQPWVFIGRSDVEGETPILWPPDVKSWLIWKDRHAGKDWGEGDDREWDGWMASPTQWTWVWVDPRSWWWTERPGMLRFMGSQRVRHNWATELNWTVLKQMISLISCFGVRDSTDLWKKKKIPANSQVITVLKSDFYQDQQLLSFTQPSESYDQGH